MLTPAAVKLPYLFAFGASAAACFTAAAVLVRRHDGPGKRELATMFFVVGWWAVNSVLRVLVTDPLGTRILLALELVLGTSAAVLWLLFAATYAGREPLSWPPARYLLGALLVGAVVLPATNLLHGLVWTAVRPEMTQGVLTYTVVKGPGHYAVTISSYLLAAVGLYYLVRLLWSTPPARPAIAALLTGFSLLLLVNVLPYVTDLLVDHPPTVTPLGAMFAAVGGIIAVQFDLFGVVAVARRSVFETLRDPVAVVDPEERLLDANDAFEARFDGASVGTSLSAVSPELAAGIDLTETGAQTVHLDDDPDSGHYSVTVSPVAAGSRLRGRSLVLRDVSDLTAATRQLQRQNEQLDEIAYSAAHNLRNPLGVIGGYADVLRTHLETVEEPGFDERLVANSLEKIETNSDRMEAIITDLLRVTHASKTASEREFVDLTGAAEAALDRVDDTGALSLSVEAGGSVWANPEQFEMLVGSLVRATRDRAGGATAIAVRLTDDGFVYEDTASPIDAEDADVFLSYGYTTKYPGTGLGLAVAQVLATSHDWGIAVDPDHCDGLRVVVTDAAVRTREGVTVVDRDGSPASDADSNADRARADDARPE